METPGTLKLLDWPLAQSWRAWAGLALVTGLAAAAGFVGAGWPAAVASVAAMAAACWRLWMPTVWELGPGGVARSVLGVTRRVPWRAVRRREFDSRGVLLHFSDDEAPGGVLTSVYIRAGGEQSRLRRVVEFYAFAGER